MSSNSHASLELHTRALLLLAAAALFIGACTLLDDPTELAPSSECVEPVGSDCPAGTEKEADYTKVSSLGSCEAGSGMRNLKDINQNVIGYCNGQAAGNDNSCDAYLCLVNEDQQNLCDGNASCDTGWQVISESTLVEEGYSADDCEENVIRNEAGEVVIECRSREGCDFYCLQAFDITCQCGEAPNGGCLPCAEACNSPVLNLYCADGSCVQVEQIYDALGCAGLCPPPEAINCVWKNQPPSSCTNEVLSSFQPPSSAFTNCQGEFFECSDGVTSISMDWTCDGYPDCPDGGDELLPRCPLLNDGDCEAQGQFDCGNGVCAPSEEDCGGCTSGGFACPEGATQCAIDASACECDDPDMQACPLDGVCVYDVASECDFQ